MTHDHVVIRTANLILFVDFRSGTATLTPRAPGATAAAVLTLAEVEAALLTAAARRKET